MPEDPANNQDNNRDKNSLPAPPIPDVDWNALMLNISPPEWDLLLSATAKNQLERVRIMVEEEGVPVTHSNGIGQTSLHVAVLWGHIDLVRFLIRAGADVNAANQLTGATPLHTALQSHKIDPEKQAFLVHLLMNDGKADPLLEDKYGKSPIEYINDQKTTHPLFKLQQYASLLPKMKPPPPGVERLQAGFMRQVMLDMPTCSIIPDSA